MSMLEKKKTETESDRQKGKKEGQVKTERAKTSRQAGRGGLGSRPGCGVVGCRGWRAGGVEWSSRCWWMSHRREAILLSFPCGTAAAEGRKNLLHIEGKTERERQTSRQTDKGRGSEGKCGWWLRATNHMVMEKGGRNYSSEHVESHMAITGLTVCFPHGCYSPAIQPPSLPQAENQSASLLLTEKKVKGDRG